MIQSWQLQGKYLFLILLLLLGGAFLHALSSGAVSLSLFEIGEYLISPEKTAGKADIFLKLRLPRVVVAFGVGASLSMAGVVMQGVFSNPLVSPYTLGISSSSSLGIAVATLLGLPQLLGEIILPISAFCAAFPVMLYLLFSPLTKHYNEKELLLMGVMFSFILSSLVLLILSLSDMTQMHTIMHWTFGSLGNSSLIGGSFTVLLSTFLLIYLVTRSFLLNALSLGEEEALAVGVNILRHRTILLIIATFLTALAVSQAGIISFMGLIIPHIMRKFTRGDHRLLLPASWLGGGIALMVTDTVARTVINPRELPVGVVTGIAGGILFLILSQKRNNG